MNLLSRTLGLVAVATLILTSSAAAEKILLKSGAKAVLTSGIFTSYGNSNENMLTLTVHLDPNANYNPMNDARSVCRLFAEKTFQTLVKNSNIRSKSAEILDIDAPLTDVRVHFKPKSEETTRFVGTQINFDMRGIVKCRPRR